MPPHSRSPTPHSTPSHPRRSSSTSTTPIAPSPKHTASCARRPPPRTGHRLGLHRLARERPRSDARDHRGVDDALRRPHLPTTLKRRLQTTGFDVETVDVVPILNADFDPHTYSARHIAIISDYVTLSLFLEVVRRREPGQPRRPPTFYGAGSQANSPERVRSLTTHS
jgi:hypothetical protein